MRLARGVWPDGACCGAPGVRDVASFRLTCPRLRDRGELVSCRIVDPFQVASAYAWKVQPVQRGRPVLDVWPEAGGLEFEWRTRHRGLYRVQVEALDSLGLVLERAQSMVRIASHWAGGGGGAGIVRRVLEGGAVAAASAVTFAGVRSVVR